MTITIQISDNGAVTTTASSNQGLQSFESNPGAGSGTDGGAPKASLGGGGDTQGSGGGDTTDIGAPPQWLSEAVGSDSASRGDTSGASGNGNDSESGMQEGGGPPEF